MWRLASIAAVAILQSSLIDAGFGESKTHDHFDEEVSKHFLKSSKGPRNRELTIENNSEFNQEKLTPFLHKQLTEGLVPLNDMYVVDSDDKRKQVEFVTAPPWDTDVSDMQFPLTFTLVINEQVSFALRKATEEAKPLMVWVTRAGCGACENLKQSVNLGLGGGKVKDKLDQFIVVHAENAAGQAWMLHGHDYVPQTYFFAPGEYAALPIHGQQPSSEHFFHDEGTLLWGMEKTLEVVSSGERSNPDGEKAEENDEELNPEGGEDEERSNPDGGKDEERSDQEDEERSANIGGKDEL